MENHITNKHSGFPLLVVIILLLIWVAFWPALTGGSLNLDDPTMVFSNVAVREMNFALIFSPQAGLYHPLTTLSLAFDYLIAKGNPQWFHFINILLHSINAVLCYLVLSRLFDRRSLAVWIAVLCFAIHPTRVESVVWITERKDVLYSLFFLLSLLSYQLYLPNKRTSYYVSSLVFFLMSLLAKPMGVSLPILLLLFDWFSTRKDWNRACVEKLPFIIIAALAIVVNIMAQRQQISIAGTFLGYKALINIINGLTLAISKAVLPIDLSVFYEPVELYPKWHDFLIVAGFLAVVSLVIITNREKRRDLFFALCFFAVSILPVLRFIKFGDSNVYNDRYLYIAGIGLFYIIGYIIEFAFKNLTLIASAIIVILTIWFSTSTASLSWQWGDSERLWSYTAKIRPESGRPMGLLGYHYLSKDMMIEARDAFAKALALDKTQPRYYAEHAYLICKLGDTDGGIAELNQGIELLTPLMELLNSKGICLLEQRKYQEAEMILKEAARAGTMLPAVEAIERRGNTYSNLGASLYLQGKTDEAKKIFREASVLAPYYAEPYFNLAIITLKEKNIDEARRLLKKVIELKPTLYEVYNELGMAELAENNAVKAEEYFRKAVMFKPTIAVAWCNIGALMVKQGKLKESEYYFVKCSEADPNNELYRDKIRQVRMRIKAESSLNTN